MTTNTYIRIGPTVKAVLPKANILKKLFQTPDSRFMLGVAFKVWMISVITELFIGYLLFTNIRLNFYFFRANGYEGILDLKGAYYEQVLSEIIDYLPFIMGFHILIFFLGLYIGYLMLRPFKTMGRYCLEVIDEPSKVFKIEDFSSYKLLTRFSEFFFDHIAVARQKNKLETRDVPSQFIGIHKPVFDGLFLVHFSLFFLIVTIISVIVTMQFATEIHINTTQIAIKMIKANPKMLSSFFQDQSFMIDEMWFISAFIVASFHLAMAIHLYGQVSGAAFGIFATMRSFIKGNFKNRVHLVGYSYLRESTRALNKYLDWIEKNIPH
jgi:hypothetical protein